VRKIKIIATISLAFYLFLLILVSNTYATPSIILYEPQNITYNTSYIPLNFTTNETANIAIFVDDVKLELENLTSYFNYIYTVPGSHYLNITAYNDNGSDFKEVWFIKNTSEETVNISTCGIITATDSYVLINDIIDSDAKTCINIYASNVTLDCQWHKIDGIDASYTIGIRTSLNSIVRDCFVSDWYYGVSAESGNVRLENIVATSNFEGFWLGSYGNPLAINLTASDNYYGVDLEYDGQELRDSKIQGNTYGFHIAYISGVKVYNNIFNNTNVFAFESSIAENYFNTTKQPGVNIWNSSLGYIGGNAWFTPNGTGYSESSSCHDTNCDGFCDDPYVLVSGYIVDYLPIAKTICQYPVIFSVVFNYNTVDFGTVTLNTIAEAKSINYSVSITTNTDYKVLVNATDWSGSTTIPANTLYFAVNDTLDNLSFATARQLSNSVQLIATFPSSVTTNYHAFYFNVPLAPPGTYTATVTITYEVV
jgi:hypothetical protein